MVDNCRSSDGEVEGLSEEFTELEVLSMVNVGLSSLSKMPLLPKLQKVRRRGHDRSLRRSDLAPKRLN